MAYATFPQRARKDVQSYSAAHDLIRATRGLPSSHDCITCGGPAQEWALMPGSPNVTAMTYGQHKGKAFSPDPMDYEPQCRSDHRKMDASLRAARKAAAA